MILRAFLAIFAMAAVTILLRAAPFLFFSRRKPPALLDYLQTYLPAVVMSLLVAASLKDYDWGGAGAALAALLAGEAAGTAALRPFAALVGIAVTAVAHAMRRRVLLSIVAGTGAYMLLIRLLS